VTYETNQAQSVAPPPPPPAPKPERKRIKALPLLIIGAFVAAVFGLAVMVSVDNDTDNSPVALADTEAADDIEAPSEPAEGPATDEPEPPSTTTTTAPEIVNVGPAEWYEWTDGLQAQVTSIEQFVPEYDSTPNPDVVVTVTVKNGTGGLYDATMSTLNLYGGPNGTQAEGEYSYSGFEGSIPPGGTATARWSFTVPAEHLTDLKIEFAPGWSDDNYVTEYDPAFFHGSAALKGE
jgi:hypothetical protein